MPADRTSTWQDAAVRAAILLTLVVSLARLIAGVVARETFGAELSFALIFALLSVAALASELTFRAQRRARPY